MLKGLGCFKFAASGFCIVTLCHGKSNGQDFYAYTAIEPQNYHTFKDDYRAGEMASFRSFGHELVRGWGREPSDDVIDYLVERYNIDFSVGENFIDHLITNFEIFSAQQRSRHIVPTATMRYRGLAPVRQAAQRQGF